MMRRSSFLFGAIQLLHLGLESNCYVVDSRNSRGYARGKLFRHLSASRNNIENDTTTKKERRSSKPKYERCPDYPRLAMKDDVTRVSLDNRRERTTKDDNDSSFVSAATGKFYDLLATASPFERDILVSGVRDSNRRTRLLNKRSYTAREPFEQEFINEPPTLSDLKPPVSPPYEALWISVPFRIFSFAVPYFLFPYIVLFLDNFVTMQPNQLADITSKFGPGVSILYGTFISLTLSILYERQRDIQSDAAVEASQLALITRQLLNIFRDSEELSIEAGQICADQIRTIAKGSRGSELLSIMYTDQYARLLEMIDEYESNLVAENKSGLLTGLEGRLSSCRSILQELFSIRSNRLSDESLALPPTHFFIMSLLTGFILLGYTINVLPTVDLATGKPSNESALLFGILTTVYVIFYNFAQDLNNPFSGLYQIRRSSVAAHLLQAKWLLVNNPYTRGKIQFDEPETGTDDVLIRTPGIGEMLFPRDEIYPDMVDSKPKDEENKLPLL